VKVSLPTLKGKERVCACSLRHCKSQLCTYWTDSGAPVRDTLRSGRPPLSGERRNRVSPQRPAMERSKVPEQLVVTSDKLLYPPSQTPRRMLKVRKLEIQ
jgi:hypothetical protein